MRRSLLKRRSQKNGAEKGFTLALGIVALVMVIPMMGLVVDVGFLYGVKGQLQASVDGAALAAARSLTLGASTAAQATSAKQTALNWFYANFPDNTWGTSNTQMDTTDSHVMVYDDASNPNLRHVDVIANTTVPTYFMKWLGATTNVIYAKGNATRRDAVVMMVLDRSGSMGATCTQLKDAAKLFTGQFAAGRDRIGLISFAGGVKIQSSPIQDFQNTLGYTNSTTGTGLIDTIKCNGGTGSAEALSLAYNELYKINLPGALNIIMFETDGAPNEGVYNWWDGTSYGLTNTSNCADTNGKMPGTGAGRGGWTAANQAPAWYGGYTMNPTGFTGYMPNIAAGAIGGFYRDNSSFYLMESPDNASVNTTSNDEYLGGSGCQFNTSGLTSNYSDFAWLPATDVYGDAISPNYPSANIVPSGRSTAGYKAVTTGTNGRTIFDGSGSDATNAQNANINVAENAAYRARGSLKSCNGSTCLATTNNLPTYMFVVGLGGNGGVDHTLLQRIANDPNGDVFNTSGGPGPNGGYYWPCSDNTHSAACATFSNQLHGQYIYSPNSTQLNSAFLLVASQVLRLSN